MTEPRAYTEAEARGMLFEHLAFIFRYWRDTEIRTKPENQSELAYRMEGALFSTLVMFDGGSMAMPALNISPSPHPDDEAYCRAHGENWWSAETVVNDTQMHEVFPWSLLREPGAPDTPPPVPKQAISIHLAVIDHGDGVNFYAQPTREALDAEIAEYCREFADQAGIELTEAMSDQEVINTYFDGIDGETLTYEDGPLTF